MSDKWFIGYLIRFRDGGAPEMQVLQRGLGSEQECEKLADMLPAIAYSGNRPIGDAQLFWMPETYLGEQAGSSSPPAAG